MPEGRPAGAASDDGRDRTTAILLMCGGVVGFAGCDASAKWLGASYDIGMVTWFRYAANVAVVFLVLNPWTRPGVMRSRRPWLQLLRSAMLLGSTLLNFTALKYLQLTETMTIQFAMPLLVALLAGPILGEWAGPRRLAAIGIGFLGVLLVTRPFGGGLHPAVLLTVASTTLYALYAIVTRMLAAHDTTATTLAYSGIVGFLALTPVLPGVWTPPARLLDWVVLCGVGLFAAFGHWLLILAHARAPAPVLSPFIYTQLAWMAALGFLVFGDVPDLSTLAGGAVVIGSGLYLLLWERNARRRPAG